MYYILYINYTLNYILITLILPKLLFNIIFSNFFYITYSIYKFYKNYLIINNIE